MKNMYSEKIKELFKNLGISELDKVRILYKDCELTGLIMPNNIKDENSIIIKLSSGYNVGLKLENIKEISIIEKSKIKSLLQNANNDNLTTSEQFEDLSKKHIAIFGCGGTIASKVEYKTGAAFPSLKPEELINDFPELHNHKPIKSELLFSLLSEDMQIQHWQLIAQKVYDEIKGNKCRGIVLTHGTDTMAFTASALSFMLRNLPIPVVFVGAQRSSDRGSSDNKINLLSAVFFAESDIAEIVVCMHENLNDQLCAIHYGTRVRKMHTSRRDAFKSINTKPLAYVDYYGKKLSINYDDYNTRNETHLNKIELKPDLNDNVALIYVHPGIKKKLFRFLSNYDGVVIAGTGLGHLPVNPFNDKFSISLLDEIKELINSNIPVVMAPQTIYGRINMNVYSTGRLLLDAGVIGNLCDWTPETALVKLMWVLGQNEFKGNMKKIKEIMETNISHEITERSEILDY